MSATIDIVGYRNKAEGNKMIMNADALLNLRAKLNAENARANNELYERQKFNIPPVSKPTLTAEEEMKDTAMQRQKALTTLKTIMKEPDALRSLDLLATANEINEFNRYATLFLRDIAGQKDITPTYFETLWDRYKDKLLATRNTGIAITTEPGEYDAELTNLSDAIKDVESGVKDVEALVSGTISAPGGLASSLASLRKDAVTLAGADEKDLESKFEDAFERQKGRKPNNRDEILIPTPGAAKFDDYIIKKSTSGKTLGMWLMSKKASKTKQWGIRPNDKVQYIIYALYGVPLGQRITWTGDPATAFLPAGKVGASPAAPIGSSAVRPAIGGPAGTGFNHFAIYGAGLEVEQPSSKLAIDNHIPKREALVPNQKNFGNYALSLNSLKKGFLCVRYPSGAHISNFPKVMISSQFRRIINDIIYENKFSEEEYMNLDESEQKLFDDLVTFCKLDKRDSIKMYKHKKYSDKDRDETIKRFNILKGEIFAGNDNPNIIKELKLLMMKMFNEKIISKAELNRIMYQLHLTI